MLGWFSPQIFLGRAQRRLLDHGLPVFTYHKLEPAPAGTTDPFLYVSSRRFDEQLQAFRQAGYASASLDELFGNDLPPGQATAGSHKVALTFDDGCRNVLDHGLPILARHQFKAIQFLVSGSLGGLNEWDIAKGDVPERLMDESEVRQWLAAGHYIGSHSATHRNLRKLKPEEAREEVFASKKLLEDKFGIEVRYFCYPYGSWNESVRDLAQEAGYRAAFTVRFGVNNPATPRYELQRVIPLSATEYLRKVLHRLGRRVR
jgi:peptidoglycan/xylan/chitin deacetylase (PgdA/CDA1 family)